jgi:hypothetical protein
MKPTAVDTVYVELRDAAAKLAAANEVSLQIALEAHARKTLLLSAASYFEMQLTREVQDFTNEVTGNNFLISNLVQTKAISRQYHQWFEWDKNNPNKFFSMFGKEFKNYMEKRLNEVDALAESGRAFMEIGRERNLLVHNDYASFPINKTPDEVYALYQKARLFVETIGAEFRACSAQLANAAVQPAP